MLGFQVGQRVCVPCDVQAGPFPDEALVTIDTGSRILSGFVQRDLVQVSQGRSFLIGTITDLRHGEIELRLPGSFFTTAGGMALIPQIWANSNLHEVRA